MKDDRRAHQCHRDGCDSEASFGVRLHVRCAEPGRMEVVKMDCSIKVCEKHKKEELVRQYILSDDNREVIRTQLTEHGHPDPDFLNTQIQFYQLAAGAEEKRTVMHVMAPVVCCDRAGCREPAKWQIKQQFRMMWQKGKGRPVIEVLTKMRVCDAHRAITKAADLLDKDSKSRTLAFLASRGPGATMVDFPTMSIDFVPLVDGRPVDPVLFVGPDQPRDAIMR